MIVRNAVREDAGEVITAPADVADRAFRHLLPCTDAAQILLQNYLDSGCPETEAPATPDKVLKGLQERREPRRDGKRVIYDEELSIRAVSAGGGKGADRTGFVLPDE